MKTVFLFLIACFCSLSAHAAEVTVQRFSLSPDTLVADSLQIDVHETLAEAITAGEENKKFIAALLAFPVPFGFLGTHRIYLGTAPWMPFAYTATLGGGGLLCLADFFAIVFADEETFRSYEHNPNVFMWMR